MILSPTDYFALHNAENLSPIFYSYFAIDSKEVLTFFRFALESKAAVTQFGDLLSVLHYITEVPSPTSCFALKSTEVRSPTACFALDVRDVLSPNYFFAPGNTEVINTTLYFAPDNTEVISTTIRFAQDTRAVSTGVWLHSLTFLLGSSDHFKLSLVLDQ